MTPQIVFLDYTGRLIRYPVERQSHVTDRHPEMSEQSGLIQDTLADPDEVRRSTDDPATVVLYYRWFENTLVGPRYVRVIVKLLDHDAFVLTAHCIDDILRGELVWARE